MLNSGSWSWKNGSGIAIPNPHCTKCPPQSTTQCVREDFMNNSSRCKCVQWSQLSVVKKFTEFTEANNVAKHWWHKQTQASFLVYWDLFLQGCYTAQKFSLEFYTLSPTCVLSLWVPTQLESGTKRPFQENEEEVVKNHLAIARWAHHNLSVTHVRTISSAHQLDNVKTLYTQFHTQITRILMKLRKTMSL